MELLIRPSQTGDAVPETCVIPDFRDWFCYLYRDTMFSTFSTIFSTARSFALRDRGFASASSSLAVTGFFVRGIGYVNRRTECSDVGKPIQMM